MRFFNYQRVCIYRLVKVKNELYRLTNPPRSLIRKYMLNIDTLYITISKEKGSVAGEMTYI